MQQPQRHASPRRALNCRLFVREYLYHPAYNATLCTCSRYARFLLDIVSLPAEGAHQLKPSYLNNTTLPYKSSTDRPISATQLPATPAPAPAGDLVPLPGTNLLLNNSAAFPWGLQGRNAQALQGIMQAWRIYLP